MRKFLIAIAAFLASAIFGTLFLLIVLMAISYLWIVFSQRNHSGIGAVVGGISEAAVLLVPMLCGVIGTLIVLHRLDRREPQPPSLPSPPRKMEY
jgi:hypothetical protein